MFFLALFSCNPSFGTTDRLAKITKVTINYEGNIDKPLPAIVFCLSCKESVSVRKYVFNMKADFFEELAAFISLNKYSKKGEGNIMLSVNIQCKDRKRMFFLKKNNARLFIEQTIKISKSKRNELMKQQLAKYKKILGV